MKRPITLLEIMIVIFLISLIGGVVGYNMKGSLERGKAFRTEIAMDQIRDIVDLQSDSLDSENLAESVENILSQSGLVKDPAQLLKDGWNEKFEFKINPKKKELEVSSKKYDSYKRKQDKKKQIR